MSTTGLVKIAAKIRISRFGSGKVLHGCDYMDRTHTLPARVTVLHVFQAWPAFKASRESQLKQSSRIRIGRQKIVVFYSLRPMSVYSLPRGVAAGPMPCLRLSDPSLDGSLLACLATVSSVKEFILPKHSASSNGMQNSSLKPIKSTSSDARTMETTEARHHNRISLQF